MKADGTNRFRLADGGSPNWSPMAAGSRSGRRADRISVMDANGRRQRRLRTVPRYLQRLVLMRSTRRGRLSGRRLAFVRSVEEPGLKDDPSGIYIVDTDGKNRRALMTFHILLGFSW